MVRQRSLPCWRWCMTDSARRRIVGEIHLSGHPASPGLAIGPVAVLTTEVASRAERGNPDQEAAALKAAIEGAASELADLIATVRGEAAEILEFQVAMLGDDALAEGAYEAIASGTAADEAWRAALEAEISGYRAADEEYFRARAADLVDIRDRVLAGLNGAGAIARISGDSVVTGDDISPSTFLAVDWTRGGGIA